MKIEAKKMKEESSEEEESDNEDARWYILEKMLQMASIGKMVATVDASSQEEDATPDESFAEKHPNIVADMVGSTTACPRYPTEEERQKKGDVTK